jgi:ketosteroid isomerase-like protein
VAEVSVSFRFSLLSAAVPLVYLHLLFLPSTTLAAQSTAADSSAVVATVRAYHAALATGDSLAALGLLAPDAVILESGDVETRAEYHAHHLAADIAYAQALPSVRGAVTVRVSGDAAWATSTSTTKGTYRERAVNSVGAELMVLSRTASGWVIRAIHWSSRNVRSGS